MTLSYGKGLNNVWGITFWHWWRHGSLWHHKTAVHNQRELWTVPLLHLVTLSLCCSFTEEGVGPAGYNTGPGTGYPGRPDMQKPVHHLPHPLVHATAAAGPAGLQQLNNQMQKAHTYCHTYVYWKFKKKIFLAWYFWAPKSYHFNREFIALSWQDCQLQYDLCRCQNLHVFGKIRGSVNSYIDTYCYIVVLADNYQTAHPTPVPNPTPRLTATNQRPAVAVSHLHVICIP